ncbi:MAG: indole-3-glycerol phosphate synthase TrpC [Desulfobacterales bacterium]|nr:indole-3-glycerol phosphate synthase TrpC [Desulfobacterales bacterium]MDJ0883294.1 indole-3-glycerol phosphate synthase TrpC [Desulfobacterales bacterium]
MDILTRIVEYKKEEVAVAARHRPLTALRAKTVEAGRRRPFFEALQHPGPGGVNIIAEIKRASPSKGILGENLDAARTARAYHEGGAAAISVLTDRHFFKGGPQDLQAARAATPLPILRKDFLIDAYQVYESLLMGADAVLLICRILSAQQLKDLMGLCRDLGLDTLVEIHSREDLEMARAVQAPLVGINNRNLSTFETDLNTAMDLGQDLDSSQIPVAASGIEGPADIRRNLESGIHNFLIGETLVRADDPATTLAQMIQAGGRKA